MDALRRKPTSTAGRPTYTVRIAPKDDGGLLGAAELAWDAVRGAPLRAAIYAQGNDEPVLEVEATEVSYGKIAADKLSTKPPAGAQGDRDRPADRLRRAGQADPHRGRRSGPKGLDFPLAAPETLAGLPRRSVLLASFGDTKGAITRYGEGLGQILVFQQKSDGQGHAGGFILPQVNIDGATRLRARHRARHDPDLRARRRALRGRRLRPAGRGGERGAGAAMTRRPSRLAGSSSATAS